MSRRLRVYMWVTDIGFLVYWCIVLLKLLPTEYLYKDYDNELMVAWNLSFIPLDFVISATGLAGMYAFRRGLELARPLVIISLTLTFCSGLQAIGFWAIRGDFDLTWWIPNLFLMVGPLFFLSGVARWQPRSRRSAGTAGVDHA